MNWVEKLSRCGDCAVCSFMGDLVLLEAIGTGVRPPHCVEEIAPPVEYAANGFALPGREQVRVAIEGGWGPRFLAVFDAEWKERLGPGFSDASSLGAEER